MPFLWDVTPYGFYKKGRLGGTYRLHHQGARISELGTTLAATSNRSALRRLTRRNIPEDGILHVRRREYHKSYT
jgi:hypothetical protein